MTIPSIRIKVLELEDCRLSVLFFLFLLLVGLYCWISGCSAAESWENKAPANGCLAYILSCVNCKFNNIYGYKTNAKSDLVSTV